MCAARRVPRSLSAASSVGLRRLSALREGLSARVGANVVPGFIDRSGWGFGMSVITGRDPPKSLGTYGWDGGLGTPWFNDPSRGLIAILMTQRAQESPMPPPICVDFWRAAYSSLERVVKHRFVVGLLKIGPGQVTLGPRWSRTLSSRSCRPRPNLPTSIR